MTIVTKMIIINRKSQIWSKTYKRIFKNVYIELWNRCILSISQSFFCPVLLNMETQDFPAWCNSLLFITVVSEKSCFHLFPGKLVNNRIDSHFYILYLFNITSSYWGNSQPPWINSLFILRGQCTAINHKTKWAGEAHFHLWRFSLRVRFNPIS